MKHFYRGQMWAIVPRYHDLLLANYRDLKNSPDLVTEAAAFKKGEKPYEPRYRVEDGVAEIALSGPIFKTNSFLCWLYDGTPADRFQKEIAAALTDPAVDALLLNIDSPGGTVAGTDEAAAAVFAAREQKPVVAFSSSLMCSAAYWIGSAAQTRICSATADIGSIGVLMTHMDWSEAYKEFGLKKTYLTAGKFKALGNEAEPLSDKARAMFQDRLDHLYGLFVDAVAQHLAVSTDTVKTNMADGRIFIGRDAVAAGLMDTIGTLADARAEALRLAESSTTLFTFGASAPGKDTSTMKIETIEQLAAAFPALVAQVRQQGADSVDTSQAATQATAAEQARILALAGVQFGKEDADKFSAIVTSGVTEAQFSAISALTPKPEASAAVNADSGKQAEMLAAIKKAGADNPGAGGGGDAADGQDFMALVEAHQLQHKCTKTEAMQAVAKKHPKTQDAWLKSKQQKS